MVVLTIRCVCGENFTYEVNLESLLHEFETTGLLPLMIPHKDHFVTAYIDKQFKIRSVERVILINREQHSTVISTDKLSEVEIHEILNEIKQEFNPNKNYFKFISALLFKFKEPEALFISGKQIGFEMWLELRKAIIKLGATYQPDVSLILKTELKPILDKTGDTKLITDNHLEIDNCIAPQFVVGLAQGILIAISNTAKEKMDIKIEYDIGNEVVNLTLKE